MRHSVFCAAFFCISALFLNACSPRASTTPEPPAPQAVAPTPEPAKTSPDSIAITGTLVNADGSPASGKTVSLHPLDKKGTPCFVSVFEESEGGGATPKPWNPKTETDATGRFTLTMPPIARLGNDPLKEVALGVEAKPEGGWVAGLVSRIHYSTPGKDDLNWEVKLMLRRLLNFREVKASASDGLIISIEIRE